MSQPGDGQYSDDIWELLNAACDGSLSDGQVDRLNEALASRDVCATFLAHLQLRAAICLHHRAGAALQPLRLAMAADRQVVVLPDTAFEPQEQASSSLRVRRLSRWRGLRDAAWRRWRQQPLRSSFMVAGLVTALGLLMLSAITVPGIVNHKVSPVAAGPADDRPVASVDQVVAARWSSKLPFFSEGTELFAGEEVAIEAGFVKLTFRDGAVVLLQGPAHLRLLGGGDAELLAGKSVVRAPKAARGFALKTRFADFVDLGTEFGVELLPEDVVELTVFEGRVSATLNDGHGTALEQWELTDQQALRIDAKQGRGSMQATRKGQFAREIPRQNWKLFDLLDIIAGGDGLGQMRQGGIDPASGERRTTYHEAQGTDDDSNTYHATASERFIDGVFVPDGEAGPVQLDSAGHTYDHFPDTDSLFYGTIWARGHTEPVRLDPKSHPEPWPYRIRNIRRYSPGGRGLLALHSNAGLTIDLLAVREAHPDWSFNAFIATVANAENQGGSHGSGAFKSTILGDVWVFVDGRLAFSRKKINSTHGVDGVRVELSPEDRYLTLVATDSGNSARYDWMVFGDPALVAVPREGAAGTEQDKGD